MFPHPPVYLDHAATTPVRPEVLEAMLPYLTDQAFGNPSSSHRFGRAARAGMEQARRQVAEAVGAEPSQVIFTSGGTEADNLGIVGSALAARDRGAEMCAAVSSIEHKAILAAAHAVCRLGGRELVIPVDAKGQARARRARRRPRRAARRRLGDVGQQRDRRRAADGGDRRPMPAAGVPLHSDAVQAFGKVPVSLADADLHHAHPLRAQDRSPQGRGRAGRPRSQGGGSDHPWRRPAARPPPRHRERGRRDRRSGGPRSSPPRSSRRGRQAPALRDRLADRLKAAVADLFVTAEGASGHHTCSAWRCRAPTARPCSCISISPASLPRADPPAPPARWSPRTC